MSPKAVSSSSQPFPPTNPPAPKGSRYSILANDEHFTVRQMPIQEAAKSPLKALKYVRVDLSKENLGGHGEVYLNISSLSKRLLLSKEEILFAKWNGQLEKLIKDRIDAISKYKQHYMTLFNEYEMKSSKTGLRASTLGKVLEVAGQLNQTGDHVLKVRGKKFLAKIEQGRIHLLDLSSKKFIGQGALGTVYKVNNIFQQSPIALKLAQPKRKEDQKIAEKDVEKEAQIINRLEPESIIYFNCKNDEMSLVGHAGPLFKSGNLFEWLQKNHPEKERLDLFKQAFQQGVDLFKREIRHGDIKLGNIFIDEKEGKLLLKIRDLGGAQFYDDENFKYRIGSSTIGYFHPNDAESLDNIVETIKELTTMLAKAPDDKQLQSELTEAQQHFKEATRKWDIFALGIVLYEIATDGYHPYKRDSDGYILENAPIRRGSLEKLDPTIKELLSKMLAPNPNVRPSLEELEKALPQIQSLVKISLK